MTAYARVITIGKNSDLPRVVRLPLGVCIDGTEVTSLVRLMADEVLCPDCRGTGQIATWDGNPGSKPAYHRCERCDGNGIITIDTETDAGSRCLSTVSAGRSEAHEYTSERPLSSGVTPVARAAGDLPRFTGRKTHTVLRRVPGLSASHSPAEVMPPDALRGTLADSIIDAVTVIAGLAVFGIVALFLLVLS